jgi:hypothetical protein
MSSGAVDLAVLVGEQRAEDGIGQLAAQQPQRFRAGFPGGQRRMLIRDGTG